MTIATENVRPLGARNPDVTAIMTGAGLSNVGDIRRNLAGVTSVVIRRRYAC